MLKTILLYAFFSFYALASIAQKETFDLVTYTAPVNWQKEVTENIISYTSINNTTKNWCRINIVKSTASKGSIELDFESEWQELMVKNYKPTEPPQLNEVQEADGWKIKAGAGKFIFNNANAMATLTTMSGFNRCVSILASTNSQDYLKDIEALLSSIELIKPETVSQQSPVTNEVRISIIGTWVASESDNSNFRVKNGVMSTIWRQYTFNTNGTYTFYSKAYDPLMDKTLLGRENGTYQINGNNIIVNPQKSVLEAWSKIANRDEWGKKLNTQNIPLEKVTYQFTNHYSEVMNRMELVLQTSKETKRDGHFSNFNNFGNAYYYPVVAPNNKSIALPE